MKKLFAAAAGLSAVLLVSPAVAEPKTIEACTQDGKTARLTLEAEGSLFDRTTESIAREAFNAAARELPGAVLLGSDGAKVFYLNMVKLNLAVRAANEGKTPDMIGQKLTLMSLTIGGPPCKP